MKLIGNIITSLILLPILLLVALGLVIYFGVRFPMWYVKNKMRKK